MKQFTLLLNEIFVCMAIFFGFAMSICHIIPSISMSIFTLAFGKELLFVHMSWGFIPIGLDAYFGILMALTLGLAHVFIIEQFAQPKRITRITFHYFDTEFKDTCDR